MCVRILVSNLCVPAGVSLKYQRLFSFLFVLFFHVGPVGLDWNKLKETLNPKFDWEAAVKAALKTDDSLEKV